MIGCFSTDAQSASRVSFSRVATDPGLGRLDFVLAVADLNGDGRDDIVAGGREEYGSNGAPEDRLVKRRCRCGAVEGARLRGRRPVCSRA